MISFAEALAHSGHELGGGSGSPEIDGLLILNSAGTYLTQANRWVCLERGPIAFPITPGHSTLSVPDLDELLGHWYSSNSTNKIEQVSPNDLLELEVSAASEPSSCTYVAVVWDEDADDLPRQVLRFWPAINGETEVRLYYRRAWKRVAADTATISIPSLLEPLYLEFVREVGQGYEESDIAKMDQRIARLCQGQTFLLAKNADARIQRSYGKVRNGAMARQMRGGGERYLNGTINPPSL